MNFKSNSFQFQILWNFEMLLNVFKFPKKRNKSIIPIKNNMVALGKDIFDVTRSLVGLDKLSPHNPGAEVDIQKVVTWANGEMCPHGPVPDLATFNLRLDGPSFCGMCIYLIAVVAKVHVKLHLCTVTRLSTWWTRMVAEVQAYHTSKLDPIMFWI